MPVSFSSTYDCWEMDGSPQESAGEGFTATVNLRCNWSERFLLLAEILGDFQLYPHEPTTLARAQSGTSRPAPGKSAQDGQGLSYDEAILTINYSLESSQGESGGNIFSESLEPNAEFITLDHSKFRWGSANGDKLQEAEAPGRLDLGFDYVLTQYNLNSIPTSALSSAGKCNQSDITASLLGITFPAETLLFQPSTPSRTLDSSGAGKWTFPARFSCKPNGWNKFWRAETQQYESIFVAGGSEYKNFPTDAFSGLVI